MKFYTNESIDAEGRLFLVDRGICVKTAIELGVASESGKIYFPYVFNGQVARYKSRSMADKKDMKFSNLPEHLKESYKTPFWNQSNVPSGDYLVITEGEFDCIALTQLGASNCVSLPNGSGSVVTTFKSQYQYLQKFKEIFICFDMDEAGNKAAEEARKLLPVDTFRRIQLKYKDANEWISNEQATFEDFKKLMEKADRIQTDEIILFKNLPRTFYNARSLGVSTGWKDLDGILGGIRVGELTVISADTGAGKTTFCINLLCNLLKNDPSGFWINSWEMDHEVIVRKVANVVLGGQLKYSPFTAKQIADFESWMEKNNALINPKQTKADIVSLRNQVELAVKVYGVKYILLDHLDYISGSINAKDNHERIAEAVIAIHKIALEFKVHIFLIAHPKQSDDKTGVVHMGQLKGSASIKQYADNIFMLHNMQQVDLSVPENRFKIAIPKNRFLGVRGEVTLRYLAEIDGYVDNTLIPRTVSNDN